jgi:hypothetical protein
MRIDEIDPGQKNTLKMTYDGEFTPPQSDSEVTSIIQLLNKNCSQVLKAYKHAGQVLYRGINNVDDNISIFHGKSRDNRRTMNTRADISEMLDNGLKNSGMIAVRSNSVFCTSDIDDAMYYGKSFMIFPLNGFVFTWNVKYKDFYTNYMANKFSNPFHSITERDAAIEEFREDSERENFAQKYSFTNMDFVKAIESEHEIMIHGEYYALRRADYKGLIKNQIGI